MNKLNFSDDYFLLTSYTISLLFMWISWNESARKYLFYITLWLARTWLVLFGEDILK